MIKSKIKYGLTKILRLLQTHKARLIDLYLIVYVVTSAQILPRDLKFLCGVCDLRNFPHFWYLYSSYSLQRLDLAFCVLPLYSKMHPERHGLDPDDRIGSQGCRLMRTQSLQPLIRESSQFLFDVNIKKRCNKLKKQTRTFNTFMTEYDYVQFWQKIKTNNYFRLL